MSSKSSQKGSRFEYTIRDLLSEKTGVKWDRVPQSGAGVIKGDLFTTQTHYYHCIECKSFKDSVIMENLLSAKSNNFYSWWDQTTREAEAMNREPALVFKKDRGKPLIAVVEDIPELNKLSLTSDLGDTYVDVSIYLFHEWLEHKDVSELIVI